MILTGHIVRQDRLLARGKRQRARPGVRAHRLAVRQLNAARDAAETSSGGSGFAVDRQVVEVQSTRSLVLRPPTTSIPTRLGRSPSTWICSGVRRRCSSHHSCQRTWSRVTASTAPAAFCRTTRISTWGVVGSGAQAQLFPYTHRLMQSNGAVHGHRRGRPQRHSGLRPRAAIDQLGHVVAPQLLLLRRVHEATACRTCHGPARHVSQNRSTADACPACGRPTPFRRGGSHRCPAPCDARAANKAQAIPRSFAHGSGSSWLTEAYRKRAALAIGLPRRTDAH